MRLYLLLASIGLTAALPARAAEAPDDARGGGIPTAADIVVTANRSPQASARVGETVTVIDRAAIERVQPQAVADLLVRTPGVSLSANGGIGSATSLRIRGAETDQTLVVIDGVKLNDPSAIGGGYNFGNLLIGDIERIEVLRGPQSTLWGSQAIGGVVSIATATPAHALEASLDAEGGSRGTGYVRGGVGGMTDRLTWRIAAARFVTDGFSAYSRGTEIDGYRNTGVSGTATIRLSEAVSVDLRGVYSGGRLAFDGFTPDFSFGDTREYGDTNELIAYGGVNVALFGGRLRNRLGYAATTTDRINFNPDQSVTDVTFTAHGRNNRIEYQGVVDIADGWTGTFGVEHERSRFRTTSPSSFDPAPPVTRAAVGIDGYYAQLQATVVAGLTLTGGVRRDEHQTFGGRTLGQAAAAWALNDGATIVRASFGQGFKAPSLYQLFSEYGNTALRPEAADGYDAGIEQHLAGGRIIMSATGFGRDTTNQIDFNACFAPGDPLCSVGGVPRFGYYANLARTRARGVELAGAATLGVWQLDANYTYTDATNRTPGSGFGKRLARRPQHSANAAATYRWPFGLATGVALRFNGDSFDNAANTTRLGGYALVDLRASLPLGHGVEVYGRIENAGDRRYATALNYGTAGRGAFAGVRVRL